MKRIQIVVVIVALIVSSLCCAIGSEQLLTSNQVARHVNDVLDVVDDYYVYPETAKSMRTFIDKQIALGRYDSIRTLKELVQRMQMDLRTVSNDGHISLHLAAESTDRGSPVRPLTKAERVVQVERIPTNQNERDIGYLRLDTFSGDSEIREQLTSAMNALQDTDALIIDLRENRGGDPDTAVFLSSYFVKESTPLWRIIDRDGISIYEAVSIASAYEYQGHVYILTSKKTYSAAEAFTYTLKHLKRARIIGQPSGGGAHLVDMERVNDDIDIRIPVVRAYSPVTKSNWEGDGVTPDIVVEALDAKSIAVTYFKNNRQDLCDSC